MLGALLLAGATAAAAGPSADERQLTALLHDFLAGASRAEAAAHERFWDEDLVYTSSAGERFGKAEILDGLRAAAESPDATDAAAATTTYRAEDIRVRVYGDAAVVAFRLVGEDAAGGVMQYFNTGTFLRRAGEWRAVAWQATRIGDG
jgi:hypothetical protein